MKFFADPRCHGKRWRLFLPGILLWLAVAGCISPGVSHTFRHGESEKALSQPRPPAQTTTQQIYDRQNVHFTNAFFYKPLESRTNPAPDLAFTLAPLFMQEADGSAAPATVAPQVVYYAVDTGRIGGRTHPQITYFWPLRTTNGKLRVERGRWIKDGGFGETALPGPASAQAVRITLDSPGRPVIWEVLHDPSGLKLMFVAESVESAASREFGKPLPGRRYSVERSLAEAAGTIVPRVIEDGPVPMGPVLYLEAELAVSTVICRCMPPQASRLAGTFTYELVPAEAQAAAEIEAAFEGLGNAENAAGVSQQLRLPSMF